MVAKLQAEVMQDLYLSKVPVNNHASIQYLSVQKQALSQVIEKVTGIEEVSSIQDIEQILSNAKRLVLKTEIETNNEPLRYGAKPYLAVITFDENQLNELLGSAFAPIWSKNRPQILTWVAVEDNRQKTIVGEDNKLDGVVLSAMSIEAEKRGLPVTLPKYDFDDSNILYPVDVWGFFLDTIETASERYSYDLLLAGRIEQQDDATFSSKWVLKQGRDVSYWDFDGLQSQAESVTRVMRAVTKKLSQKFAILGDMSGQNRITVEVGPVLSIKDYSGVLTYLEKLKVVADVAVIAANNSKLILSIELSGTLNTFNHYISLDNKLIPEQKPASEFEVNQELANDKEEVVHGYRWQTGY